jgi:hypothetical protein
MPRPLPALRRTLDLMPSPVAEQPGLLIRDPFRYSDTVMIVPPQLAPLLGHFDGRSTELDLRQALVRLTGQLQVGDLMAHLQDSLSAAGFLEDAVFARLKQAREAAFVAAAWREPVLSGSGGYPSEPAALRDLLARHLDVAGPALGRHGLRGIAAPHVSLEGGWDSYRAAYQALGPELADRTFVVLGTSHYGAPERFGLTRKPYRTPLGDAAVDVALLDRLAREGGPALQMEDYCHAVEHSIEFQVLLLQHRFGPSVRVVPVLCGPFAKATLGSGRPEGDPGVARFLGALGDLAARESDRVFWVLGVDMTHLGRRYGDPFVARAREGRMAAVAERDQQRIERLSAADADGFWALVQQRGDDLRWCGASPFYAFLRAVAPARGDLLQYQQWNIDEASVVSFAGMAFS